MVTGVSRVRDGWLSWSRWLCVAGLALVVAACGDDSIAGNNNLGDRDGGTLDASGVDAQFLDGEIPDASPVDGGGAMDSSVDSAIPPCTGDTFECQTDGSARICDDGSWVDLGTCPLGCDPVTRACRVPSNVPASALGEGTEHLTISTALSPVSINTDTGEILDGLGGTLRPAGTGLDATSGIAFSTVDQGASQPGLGVFSMGSLTVALGATLVVEGSNALALLVDGNVTLNGSIELVASGQAGAPGGWAGGDPDQPGEGPCGGLPGTGDPGGHLCTSGSGGGGHSGAGGAGGDSTCGTPDDHVGGTGGAGTCGNETLIPLAGGSGGAGGCLVAGAPSPAPGPGGGGGGALQITAAGLIELGSSSVINAGGGGGGECTTAGGSGAGAGGAILLEASEVTIAAGGVLAANGGGGGGGD